MPLWRSAYLVKHRDNLLPYYPPYQACLYEEENCWVCCIRYNPVQAHTACRKMLRRGQILFEFSVELKLTFALLFLELSRVNRTMACVPRQTSNIRLHAARDNLVSRVLTEIITD
jgi:hypothetical protein